MDLPRRAILHRQHNALVHHKRGPLSESALPDEIRAQQDEEEGDAEDHLRLDPEYRDQPTSELNVFEGEPPHQSHFRFPSAIIYRRIF